MTSIERTQRDGGVSSISEISCSIVVPVFNGERTLAELTQRLEDSLKETVEDFEVICVNDGSEDGTWREITGLAASHGFVRGIDLLRNFGQHNALLAGIRAARFPIIVTMDDDLQNPPEEIHLLLEKIVDGADFVYGYPIKKQQDFNRRIASRILMLAFQAALGAETARYVSSFRAFKSELREAFRDFRGPYVSIDVLLTWGSLRSTAVLVRHESRAQGTSHYSFRKLTTHALNMMTGFSILPLQLASFVGFGFTAFGIAVLLYVLGRYILHGGSVPGFPFLASVIAIFSGAQLFALGIIGEYLARMHFRLVEKPSYAVRETTDVKGP